MVYDETVLALHDTMEVIYFFTLIVQVLSFVYLNYYSSITTFMGVLNGISFFGMLFMFAIKKARGI
jgi:hypothetical protein